MRREKIVVIEAISSSVNYISDIRDMGYEPILLERWVSEERREDRRKWHDNYYALNGDTMPEIIMASQSYKDILALMKKIDPILILPGADHAVYLATSLSADMGLPCNDSKNLDAMISKDDMQYALKKAGLRYIDTVTIYDLEDALQFFRKKGKKSVIVKPQCGSATVGVTRCYSEEDIVAAVENIKRFFGGADIRGAVVIQEYIDGVEYVIDTISSNGKHRTIFSMKYEKQFLDRSHKIYDTDEYIDSGAEEYKYLSDYMYRVLDAIGISYGPVHSEIMVDENGPVLVEINCRPAGASVKRSFQDRVLGCHETREALEAYLYPESFPEKIRKFGRYGQLICPAMVKNMIMPDDVFVKHLKYKETAGKLASFVYMLTNGENCVYKKTVDLNSAAGMIYLANEDENQLKKDCNYLKWLEKNDLSALYEYQSIY